MKKRSVPRGAVWAYVVLISIASLQQVALYLHSRIHGAYQLTELLLLIGSLVALVAGLLLSVRRTIICVGMFLIAYPIWLVSYNNIGAWNLFWLLLIPGNAIIASRIQTLLRRESPTESLYGPQSTSPGLRLCTNLGNKEALQEAVMRHSNLARRFPECYSLCIMMFKVKPQPADTEPLDSVGCARLLMDLSNSIQRELRFDDYTFFIGEGRFVILCPMMNEDYVQLLIGRLKAALMQVEYINSQGHHIQIIVRSGAMVFQLEQWEQYPCIDTVISELEHHSRTDLDVQGLSVIR